MSGPVEKLLAETPAQYIIGGINPRVEGALPWSISYGLGKPGSKSWRPNSATTPFFIAGAFGLLFVAITVSNSMDRSLTTPEILGGVVILAVLVGLIFPQLYRRSKGALQWSRKVVINADTVRVTDKGDTETVLWEEPLSAYRDIHHSVQSIGAGDSGTAGGTRVTELDVVELRHANQGRTIYLRGTKRNMLGGMNVMEIIQAGREGRKDDVRAAVGNAHNPEFQAYLNNLSEQLGLPVTRDKKASEAVA